MLEVATIRNVGSADEDGATIGHVLDAALYYGRVHLYLDYSGLSGLVRCIGFDDVDTLLRHPSITATITHDSPAVHTSGLLQLHTPIFFSSSYSTDPKARSDPKSNLGRLFNGERNSPYLTKQQIGKMVSNAKLTSYDRLLGEEWKTNKLWTSLVRDPETLKLVLRNVAEKRAWDINVKAFANLKIRIHEIDGQHIIDSTPELDAIVKSRTDEAPTWAAVLVELNNFRLDMYFAASGSSDLMLPRLSAKLAAERTDLALMRGMQQAENIVQFNERVFDNGKPIGDLYESKAITLKEALKLIDQAAKFRSIIHGKSQDSDLLQEFFNEVSREGVLDRSPSKHLKFLGYGAVSLGSLFLNPVVGTGIAIGATAFDIYLLPKITDRWKPNMFVRSIKQKLDQ